MKTSFNLLGILILCAFFGCSSTGNNKSGPNPDENKFILATNLPNYINSISKLEVRGTGNNLNVINISTSTKYGDTHPLFVLDGIQMGKDLTQIMQLLTPGEKITVDFISSGSGAIRYGEAGKDGVIKIKRVSKN